MARVSDIFDESLGWTPHGTVKGKQVFDMRFTSGRNNGLIRCSVSKNNVWVELFHGNDRCAMMSKLDEKSLNDTLDALSRDFSHIVDIRAIIDSRKTTRTIEGRTVTVEQANLQH